MALDAGPLRALLAAGPGARLTLCGERQARSWAPVQRGLWQRLAARWRPVDSHDVLEAL